jgi:branched-chain amino acid transport system ATP-binding protein
MLRIANLSASYDQVRVLHDVSLEVKEGEIVTLIGANGAGKTTTLSCIMGLLPGWSGMIEFDGCLLNSLEPERIVRLGLAMVPEDRGLFGPLTVQENLMLGAYFRLRRDRSLLKNDLNQVFELFPILRERVKQPVATLSGGQQQMVAIGRALMAKPRLLLLDEPSLGLAPLVIREIYRVIQALNQNGVTILLVEQNAHLALNISHRGYVMENGAIVLQGSAAKLADLPEVRQAYLGKAARKKK